VRALSCLVLVLSLAVPARADTDPPTIVHDELKSGRLGHPLVIEATITDDSGVFDPVVLYRVGSEGEFLREPLVAVEGEEGRFTATIPGDVVSDDVQYFLEAFDQNGNGPARYAEQSLPVTVKVLKTAEPLPDAPAPAETPTDTEPEEVEDEGGGAALWIGLGAGVGALVVGAAVIGGVAAYLALRPPEVPPRVDVSITAPTPTSGGS
jgi:hypothetical protein